VVGLLTVDEPHLPVLVSKEDVDQRLELIGFLDVLKRELLMEGVIAIEVLVLVEVPDEVVLTLLGRV